jgi:hypothetical protein
MERRARTKLRIGHVSLRHRLPFAHMASPALIFTLAQGHMLPCTWAHAFVILPGHAEPFTRHFGFDAPEILQFRQQNPGQSLDWLDSDFMLNLAIQQVLRQIPEWLPCARDELGQPERIDAPTLMLHHLNGDFPQLDSLLKMCGEFYLLYQELLALKQFPALQSR